MTAMHWPALATALAVLLLFACAFAVGRARGRYGVHAPATAGPPEFERMFRMHMNTLENTVAFVPVLWLAAVYWNPDYAGWIGLVWVAARVWYAFAYGGGYGSRTPGFTISALALLLLLLIALGGIAMALVG